MPSIHFRPARLDEVPSLAQLRSENEAGGATPDRMLGYLAATHHPQQAQLPRAMWVALQGDAAIGYVAGHLTSRFGCDGELEWIYVVASHRRQRVGSGLLRLLAAWLVERSATRVCVDVGDEMARPFYARYGAVALDRHWMVWNDIHEVVASTDAAATNGTE